MNSKLISRIRKYQVTLESQLAPPSGEGIVYRTNIPGVIAKIYAAPTSIQEKKLHVLINNAPKNPTLGINHISLALPIDILEDASGRFCGFLMPMIPDACQLDKVYRSTERPPEFDWKYLHTTAQHLASAVEAVHAKQFIVCDIKPQNVLVNRRALITIIDTDSFQIRDPNTSQVFRSNVGSSEFTPPELIGKKFTDVDRYEYHDLFGLGVLIHYLLFFCHPFTGIWKSSQLEISEIDQRVLRGYWAYGKSSPIAPSPVMVPLKIVHPELINLFHRCFTEGHTSPHKRPTASEWKRTLNLAIQDLADCSISQNHKYSRQYGRCCWCEFKNQFKKDIYFPNSSISPATTTVQNPVNGAKQHTISPNPHVVPNTMPVIPNSYQAPSPPRPTPVMLPSNSYPPVSQGNSGELKNLIKRCASLIAGIVALGIVVDLIKSCTPTSSPGRNGQSNSPIREEQPGSRIRSNPSDSNASNQPIRSFSFPMNSCGDAGNPTDGVWHPVFVQTQQISLSTIRSNFCGDAFLKYRDSIGRKDIQVASFRNRDKAEEFAKALRSETGAGEVGRP